MNYLPQQRKGFIINSELADVLGLFDEYVAWEEQKDCESFCTAFEEKFGVFPDAVHTFEDDRGEAIHNLTGFEWDTAYVLFEDYQEGTPDWEAMVEVLEEEDVNLDNGSWAVLA